MSVSQYVSSWQDWQVCYIANDSTSPMDLEVHNADCNAELGYRKQPHKYVLHRCQWTYQSSFLQLEQMGALDICPSFRSTVIGYTSRISIFVLFSWFLAVIDWYTVERNTRLLNLPRSQNCLKNCTYIDHWIQNRGAKNENQQQAQIQIQHDSHKVLRWVLGNFHDQGLSFEA